MGQRTVVVVLAILLLWLSAISDLGHEASNSEASVGEGPSAKVLLPFAPLLLYLLLCLGTLGRQLQQIPVRRHELLDARMTANLTLVGFGFAVLGLLVTLFQSSLSQVREPIFLFAVSLASFLASYVFLYLRLRRAFDTVSDGLTNNGLWCLIYGLGALFLAFEELKSMSWLFSFLLWLLGSYITLDIIFK